MQGLCEPWPATWPCDISCESPTATGRAITIASEIVHSLSGRQFGLCTVALRPCRRECFETPWADSWTHWPGSSWLSPALIGGQWFNIVCGSCGDNCSCSSLSEVVLPARVDSIIEVKVDGSPLVTGAYRVDDNRTLVRIDGGSWPRCNDLNRADTQVGTWSVTARYGEEVPDLGQAAVGELACQIMRALGGEDCRLPANVQTLVRQGVTIAFPDPLQLFEGGLTGLYLVDLFIQTYNPHHLVRRAKTYSVDRPRARRVGT